MPELTPRLGIKKPLGNENVTRQSFNENWDIIDAKVATLNTDGTLYADKVGGKTASATPQTVEKNDLIGMINEAFTSANNGKTAVANAVTAKGVSASPSDTFSVLADKIGQINTGKKYATGTATSDSSGYITVTGLSFEPSIIIAYNAARTDYYEHATYLKELGGTYGNNFYVTGGEFATSNPTTSSVYDGYFKLKTNRNSVPFNWVAYE